jgi:hypothetical protein
MGCLGNGLLLAEQAVTSIILSQGGQRALKENSECKLEFISYIKFSMYPFCSQNYPVHSFHLISECSCLVVINRQLCPTDTYSYVKIFKPNMTRWHLVWQPTFNFIIGRISDF